MTAVVADGAPLYQRAVEDVLRCDLHARIVKTAPDVKSALQLLYSVRPDLAIIDRDLPDGDVLKDLVRFARLVPRTSIVLVGVRLSMGDVVRASAARVRGFALKTDSLDELRRVIRTALAGRTGYARSVLRNRATSLSAAGIRAVAAGSNARLTPREVEVLSCIAQGMSLKEIAATLRIRPRTVDTHKSAIMAKLDIHDRVLLARYAIREGLASV